MHMHFLRKCVTNSSKIDQIRVFSRLIVLKCAFFAFSINTLLFRLMSGKFAIFVINCRNVNFFHIWYVWNPRSFFVSTLVFHRKPVKYVIFSYEVPNFQIELHSIPELSPPIGSKKLGRGSFVSLKQTFPEKREFFKAGVSFAFAILFDGISKFWAWISLSRLEIQTLCIVSWN